MTGGYAWRLRPQPPALKEQVEEEKTIRDIVHKFNLVKHDPASLLDLDRELGDRKPEDEGGE